MNSVIKTEKLRKEYPLPRGALCVFNELDFELGAGELAAVMGASGVGKTTFLNLLGILDRPTSGRVLIEGEDVHRLDDREKAVIRNKKIGFVFQFYHLLPEFSCLENVGLPLMIGGMRRGEAVERARELLKEVGLEAKADLLPRLISGGEQQRVAVARALINEPKILLADEPTGNLDRKTGANVLEMIRNLHRGRGLSSVIVTHNENVARLCDKTFMMEEGRLKRIVLS